MNDWNPELHLITSPGQIDEFLRWLGERRPVLAFDTETTGLEWSDRVRLVQFGDARAGWAIPADDWPGLVRHVLDAYQGEWVAHNAAFDQRMLWNSFGRIAPWSSLHDTKIAATLYDPFRFSGLKSQCVARYGQEMGAGQDLLRLAMSENKWTWGTVPIDLPAYWAYGALDTCLTARLYEEFTGSFDERYDREMAVARIMWQSEMRGVRVDLDYTSRLGEWYVACANEIQDRYDFNLGSNDAVGAALVADGWEPTAWTETGKPQVDRAALDAIGSPLAADVRAYRRYIKWSSSYCVGILKRYDEHDRVHPRINPLHARTGRMSIEAPPVQQIPKRESTDVRDCFVASEGKVLVPIDYDTQETRLLAFYANELDLKEAFAAGEDIHQYVADETGLTRSQAKNVGYALLYGAGDEKLGVTAGTSTDAAREFRAKYLARFPGVENFMGKVIALGKKRIYSDGHAWAKTVGGRVVHADKDKVYALTNYLLQGSGADILKEALVRLDNEGYSPLVLLPVHDEIVFEVPSDEAEALAPRLAEIMSTSVGDVPLPCDPGSPRFRWGGGAP